tara:strand:- start:489 stop:704 length:216 start_codon:yes stop_codon:yes gene_type:complete
MKESGLTSQSYGLALNDKTLRFLVRCIDIAQKTESISPDAEESDLIRRLGKKADELLDDEYDEYSEYDLKE